MAETTELMQRPKASDALTKKRTLEIFMPKVAAYLGADFSESERPYIEEQLSKVMSRGNHDGYEMARELENSFGWSVDRGLMDLMDECGDCLMLAKRELTKQWIQVYGIKPTRAVGDQVSTTHWRRPGEVGTIVRIFEESAEYGVHFSDQPVTSSQVLLFEEVSAANVEVAGA